VTDLGNREATDMGNDFLPVLVVYYGDDFSYRYNVFQVTTLGITGYSFHFACKETDLKMNE
jgi:hypothetical protein